nr:hypothetical protein [Serratia marcescens]
SLKTSIKTITNLSDSNCLEIQGASLTWNNLRPFSVDVKTGQVTLANATVTGTLKVGNSTHASDGNIWGTRWGSKWLWDAVIEQVNGRVDWGSYNRDVGARATTDYVNGTFVRDIRLGGVESVKAWNGPGYRDQGPYVLTGAENGNGDEYIDILYRRPMQKNVNNVWYNVWFV